MLGNSDETLRRSDTMRKASSKSWAALGRERGYWPPALKSANRLTGKDGVG